MKKRIERLRSGNAIIYGHSDGDGHLAAEQTRRNLLEDGCDVTSVVVHPMFTRNFRFWEQHFQEANFGDNEHVFVVDIMLANPDVAATWDAVCSRVKKEPDRQFYIIDHHKVAMPSALPRNLHVEIREAVYECCYGTPSELMLIASICDKDEAPVAAKLTEHHRRLARGISRASTERAVLSGQPLLYLLRNNHWSVFEQLADEPADFHRTFYGNRTSKQPLSPLLQMAYAVHSGATN